jgi:hypothetical protein
VEGVSTALSSAGEWFALNASEVRLLAAAF